MTAPLNNMKEASIFEFLGQINFAPGKWSIAEIKRGLRRILHEEPAVELRWNVLEKVNETTGEIKKVDTPTSLTVFYTTDDIHDPKKKYSGNVTILL